MATADSRQKGALAETAVQHLLSSLPGIAEVTRTNPLDDSAHRDFAVLLGKPATTLGVQAKYLSQHTLRIDSSHLRAWHKLPYLTVIIWWSEKEQRFYWADPLRRLFRGGGFHGDRTTFNENRDLALLDPRDSPSVERFVCQVASVARMWGTLNDQPVDDWKSHPLYPVTLAAISQNPSLLDYLPLSSKMVKLLHE
jgi:hypothetical protein